MHVRFETGAHHIRRIFNIFQTVDGKRLRDDVQQFSVLRNKNRARIVDRPLYVAPRHFPRRPPGFGHRRYAPLIQTFDLRAADADRALGHFGTGRLFGAFDRFFYRSGGVFDIDDDSVSEPRRLSRSRSCDFNTARIVQFSDRDAYMVRTDIKTDNHTCLSSLQRVR